MRIGFLMPFLPVSMKEALVHHIKNDMMQSSRLSEGNPVDLIL